MNIVTYSGRLTADNKVDYSAAGTAYLRNTIAVRNPYKKEGEKDDFFRFTAFGKNAENLEKYTRKGSMVLLSGSNHLNEYKNKDGQTIREVILSVEKVEFLDSKKEESNKSDNEFLTVNSTDELPFE